MAKAKALIKEVLPAPVFNAVRDWPYLVYDAIRGRLTPPDLVPPLHLMFDGPRSREEFIANGQECLSFYRDVVGVEPHHAILDIGSGIGRKTVPLLDYLDEDGRYVGIDIDQRGIDWCSKNITRRNPRFVFLRLDVHNKFYNPQGAIKPSEIVFPFADEAFDVVVLWSVFTHLYPSDIDRYLSEITRMLKPGGRLIGSFFVMDEESLARVAQGSADFQFVHAVPDGWTSNPNIPEDAIAVEIGWLEDTLTRRRLAIDRVHHGRWSGHPVAPGYHSLNHQDILVARRIG